MLPEKGDLYLSFGRYAQAILLLTEWKLRDSWNLAPYPTSENYMMLSVPSIDRASTSLKALAWDSDKTGYTITWT